MKKKTYEKPALLSQGDLNAMTAGGLISKEV